MSEYFDDLRNGVALAELGGYGDGPYCAKYCAGGALALMGTYVVDPGNHVDYPRDFTFKSGRDNYEVYLRKHVTAARASGAKVGVSVVSVEMADTLDFMRCSEQAGADYVSYCAYSSMEMFTSRGLSSTLCKRQNWSEIVYFFQFIFFHNFPVRSAVFILNIEEKFVGPRNYGNVFLCHKIFVRITGIFIIGFFNFLFPCFTEQLGIILCIREDNCKSNLTVKMILTLCKYKMI